MFKVTQSVSGRIGILIRWVWLYNLIPYQVDLSKNFYKGLNLSILDDEPTIHVSVMVAYTNKEKSKNYREFFRLAITAENTEE